MKTIRIPEEHWGRVWLALLKMGPISRISTERIYMISDKQLHMLRRKKLPFELMEDNGEPFRGSDNHV